MLISVPQWRRLQPVLRASVEPRGEAPGASWRGNIPGSIREVITGTRDGSSVEAWHAARAAGLADDIRQLPMGMNTLVTDQGTFDELVASGGEFARLAQRQLA